MKTDTITKPGPLSQAIKRRYAARKPKKPFVKPFRMGDVITVSRLRGGIEVPAIVVEHVIHEVKFDGDSYEYSTHRSAWHSHKACTLVRECDEQSMKQLKDALRIEEDSYEEAI